MSEVFLESYLGEVTVLSDAFDRKDVSQEEFECVEGLLTGQSKGLKRPTFYRDGNTSGERKCDTPWMYDESTIVVIN